MFGLGTFASRPGDVFPALVIDELAVDLRPHLGPATTTSALLARWDDALPRLKELASSRTENAVALDRLRPLPPVRPIGQFFCAGANYRKHLTEIMVTMARNDPDDARPQATLEEDAVRFVEERAASGTPFVFAMPSSAVSGARDDIVLWGPGVQHDWELELAVVIGRPAHRVPPDQ
ncbi:MAG: fumarylacetoacetate hydrolase family protein, partial [Solirubrobacterales bacterium]|nr:fumarylacetoacetate hydrolase family protein [Solirubrobacterales bacterium]